MKTRSLAKANLTGLARFEVALILLTGGLASLAASPVLGAGNVSYCDEGGLRSAITGGGTVTFSCSGTINLASTIDVYYNLTLDGAGRSVTISGNNAVRVFLVQSGYSLTLKDITIANGWVGAGYPGGAIQTFGTLNIQNSTISNSQADLGAGIYANDGSVTTITNSIITGNQATSGANATGGGILNGGTLTATNSTFSNNTATNDGGAIASVTGANISGCTFSNNSAGGGSGGIYANGPLTVTNSIFTGNSAGTSGGAGLTVYYTTGTISNSTFTGNTSGGDGGGIRVAGAGTEATITNCTFSGNTAAYKGGGVHNVSGTATMTNCTFVGNGSTYDMFSGNLSDYNGTTTTKNTIIANSTKGANCSGAIVDGGGNFVWGDASCPGSNVNPLLGALGNYGGYNQTYPLLPGSPVINAASANCPATDQRGIARGTTCDSGAFESQGFTLTKTGGDNQSTVVNTAFAIPLSLSVASAFSEPVNGGIVTFSPPVSGASASLTPNPATISGGAVSVSATANGTIGGPYSVTVSAAGAVNVTFALRNKCVPVITWSNPANIVYGTALGATQLNASADVPGTFVYSPLAGTVLNAGPHTLHVDFTPNSTADYTNADKDVSITVTQATPAITWNNPVDIVYGTALGATQLNATADVTGAFTYTPPAGTILTIGTQSLKVDFVPDNTTNYKNASKNVSIMVTGGGYYSLSPCRVFDTRVAGSLTTGDPLIANDSKVFAIVGYCQIPASAKAIVANVTVVNGTAAGELNIIAGDISPTGTSLMYIPLARARANNGVIQLATNGTGTILVSNNSSGTVHLILDVNGYFQ